MKKETVDQPSFSPSEETRRADPLSWTRLGSWINTGPIAGVDTGRDTVAHCLVERHNAEITSLRATLEERTRERDAAVVKLDRKVASMQATIDLLDDTLGVEMAQRKANRVRAEAAEAQLRAAEATLTAWRERICAEIATQERYAAGEQPASPHFDTPEHRSAHRHTATVLRLMFQVEALEAALGSSPAACPSTTLSGPCTCVDARHVGSSPAAKEPQ